MHWSVSFLVPDAQACFWTFCLTFMLLHWCTTFALLLTATRCRTSCRTPCHTSRRNSWQDSLAPPFDVLPCTKCDSPLCCTSLVFSASRYPNPQFTLAGWAKPETDQFKYLIQVFGSTVEHPHMFAIVSQITFQHPFFLLLTSSNLPLLANFLFKKFILLFYSHKFFINYLKQLFLHLIQIL